MTAEEYLQAGIQAAQAGNRELASQWLTQAVKADPRSEYGWLWLGRCREAAEQRRFCFERVLAINPRNAEARQLLDEMLHPEWLKELQEEVETQSDFSPEPVDPKKDIRPASPASQDVAETKPTAAPVSPASPARPVPAPATRRLSKATVTLLSVLGGLVFLCGLAGVYLVFFGPGCQWLNPAADLPALATMPPMTAQEQTPEGLLVPDATATSSPTPDFIPAFRQNTCWFKPPKGVKVDCGYVGVPENRQVSLAHRISLAVAVYRSTSSQPAPDPVIYLQGGPGAGALDWSVGVYTTTILPILAERDFIVFDPRGTGRSQPRLQCEDLRRAYAQDLLNAYSPEERAQLYIENLTICRDKLKSQGTDLSAYNTAATAADAVDIVTAMGYDRANFYGSSYGTRLAQAVMRDFPSRVRSAIIDSVVPVERNVLKGDAENGRAALQKLFQSCAEDPACHQAYPKLEAEFNSLVAQYDAKPVKLTVTLATGGKTYEVRMDGAVLINTVLAALKVSELVAALPQAIHRAYEGETFTLSAMMGYPLLSIEEIALGDYLSMICHDQIYSTAGDPASQDAEGAENKVEGLAWLYSPQASAEVCQVWGAKPLAEGEYDPVVSDIPTLVFAGRFDPTTPPDFAQQVAGHLAHSYYYEISDQSHCPSLSSLASCPVKILTAFLHDPQTEPEHSCLEAAPPRFVVTGAVDTSGEWTEIEDGELELIYQVPPGWKLAGSGIFVRRNSYLDLTQMQMAVINTSPQFILFALQNQKGYEKPLSAAGSRQAHGLSWEIYRTSIEGHPIEVALAGFDQNHQTLLVTLISYNDEQDLLYQKTLLPFLDRIQIMP